MAAGKKGERDSSGADASRPAAGARRAGSGKSSRADSTGGFSAEEKAAMRERARELAAQARGSRKGGKYDGEADLLEKVAQMSGTDRQIAERLHRLAKDVAPDLKPKTWYGMPAYADGAGRVVCFFQPAEKFKSRYATIGFTDQAKLDEGAMWPTTFAILSMGPSEDKKVRSLLKKALGSG